MWEITRWPFHEQDLNDKLMFMPWLRTPLVFFQTAKPFGLISLNMTDYCTTDETTQRVKVSHKSVAVDSWWVCFSQFFSLREFWRLFQSDNSSSSWSERNQWPLISLPHAMTLSEWWNGGVKKSTDNGGRQTGCSKKTERERKKKIDTVWGQTEGRRPHHRQKTKTPKTTACLSPGSWKIHHYQVHESQCILWSAQREVSYNIHLNWERPIQTQPCWDKYCRRHWGMGWL